MNTFQTHERAHHPAFGAADLSNCERELIHLAGSVQPHGLLLVLHEPDLIVVQASANTQVFLGVPNGALLGEPIGRWAEDLAKQLAPLLKANLLTLPAPIRCTIDRMGTQATMQGTVHRLPRAGVIVELEPVESEETEFERNLPNVLSAAVGRITSAASLPQLADEVVRCVRELAGYDRVMVYRFDADGHGEVVAEAREERLEPLLGLHYPASDIPQRARELYLRNRVRVLVDVRYEPVALVPRHSPDHGEELDMSLCSLRSMSPLHLQYLQNMGVTATLVASLVREGRLWGLIACHHYSTKSVSYAMRAACELLGEVISTRISALENRAQVEAELFIREFETGLVTAASETGDWRDALFADPESQLLRPFDATGAALFYEGEVLTAGETPTLPELRALADWLEESVREPMMHTSALPRLNTALASLAPTATGALAIELSHRDGEYLVWFRKEQIRTVTWAGNPEKPMVVGNDPLDLSPRRSFAAWSELVRETAKPWSPAQLATAAVLRRSLVDVILQMRALRALIAERQATTALAVIESAGEAMILADGDGKVLIVNSAFHRLVERPMLHVGDIDDLLGLTTDRTQMIEVLNRLSSDRQAWRGELRLARSAGGDLPVAVRADPVPGLRGDVLGYIFIFSDLRQQREARAVRARLEQAIAQSHAGPPLGDVAVKLTQDFDDLLSAILSNASATIVQFGDATGEESTATLLRELEVATRRAAELTAQIRGTASRNRLSS
ncbi:MAG: GAF domain-containing protein [bacterium]